MTKTISADSIEGRQIRSSLKAARQRMSAFIAKHSTAKLDDEATIDFAGNIVVCGDVCELLLVKAWATLIGIEGVTVEQPHEDDPDWSCCRIPQDACERALAKLQARR